MGIKESLESEQSDTGKHRVDLAKILIVIHEINSMTAWTQHLLATSIMIIFINYNSKLVAP